jgi:hypothetical protein
MFRISFVSLESENDVSFAEISYQGWEGVAFLSLP